MVKESIENVRNKLEIKTQFEKEKLAEMGVDVNWLPDVCTEIEKLGTYRGRTSYNSNRRQSGKLPWRSR